MSKLNPTDADLVEIARQGGIVQPEIAMNLSRNIGVPFFVTCAYLEQETAGGHNVFGSDDTWFRGVDLARDLGNRDVTKERYLIYRMHRDRFGNQGVGPLQLTHPDFQNEADQRGGCWLPKINIEVGLRFINNLKEGGLTWHEVAKRYNGSEDYANHNDVLREKWRNRFRAA